MLKELYINNILLIQQAIINFQSGLNIITGQTGSGKSILLESLGIVLGDRISSNIIREGEEKASIVAVFDITNNEEVLNILKELDLYNENNELFIKKVITKNGSKIFINDTLCTVNVVSRIAPFIVEIHSQFEQVDLLMTKNHLNIIDKFGKFTSEVIVISKLFERIKEKELYIFNLEREIEILNNQKEFLTEAIKDFENLNIQKDEYLDLIDRRKILTDSEKISTYIKNIISISDNMKISQSISKMQDNLSKILFSNNAITSEMKDKLSFLDLSLEKLLSDFNIINEEISFIDSKNGNNDYELSNIESRIAEINDFSRKYKVNQIEIYEFGDKIKNDVSLTKYSDDTIKKEKLELQKIKEEFLNLANSLSYKRKEVALKFSQQVCENLKNLKMEFAKFEVLFERSEEIMKNGIDKVTFIGSMNPGMNMAAIHKIASGGEMSRFMLALKTVLAKDNLCNVIIFDEIDTGVSGNVAYTIGKELKKLANSIQVICVTHNPQVTVFGNNHLLVSKNYQNGRTNTVIEELDFERRVEEVAKMISGDVISEEAILNAKKLMNNANL